MKKQSINSILKEVLIEVNPPKEEIEKINKFLNEFIPVFKKKLKTLKINADIFVGGSFAKKTLIKKGIYDIDLFVRFSEKYKTEEISQLTEKALKGIKQSKGFSLVHGSRDYFRISASKIFYIEIIPVKKVNNPKYAENITDLSYFHVGYIKKKLKTEKLLEQVRLLKAFCHSNNSYGAEGYINGFSGYALELLICNYKSFLNFLKAVVKIKDKNIIDLEKQYKNKQEVLMNMNSAKMTSPIILIDATYKERNALAALSEETFENFKKYCTRFLKNPSKEYFETKKIDFEKEKQNAVKIKNEFLLLELATEKQEGDIAGSKLIKFYKHFAEEVSKFYKISKKGFEYNDEKEAFCFFSVKSLKELLLIGPEINQKENVIAFKKKHKNTFVKAGRIYAKEKLTKTMQEFAKEWKLKNAGKMKEMHIREMNLR